YDPELWNSHRNPVIHLDIEPAEYQLNYQPCVEIVGNIAQSLDKMGSYISEYARLSPTALSVLEEVALQRQVIKTYPNVYHKQGFHPLALIKSMQSIITPDTTRCLDMGSFQIWIARYLSCFRAR
ncbi:acetolactate synthase AlsS, partial [Vibrio parahaemolyticus]|nr:acetolactate synthase AlsS [Vibrio parahaemolyticus]